MDDRILEAAGKLLQLLIDKFGPWGTIGLVFAVLVLLFVYRVYKDWRAERTIDRALAEKERSIQRLANQERTWRRVFLTRVLGFSEAEADRCLQLEGDYEDAEQSRTAVEGKTEKREHKGEQRGKQ